MEMVSLELQVFNSYNDYMNCWFYKSMLVDFVNYRIYKSMVELYAFCKYRPQHTP